VSKMSGGAFVIRRFLSVLLARLTREGNGPRAGDIPDELLEVLELAVRERVHLRLAWFRDRLALSLNCP
jgi:hypothetical protein